MSEKTKIIICGISGKMGGNVLSLLENDGEAEAVCGVDPFVKPPRAATWIRRLCL